jgi:DnaJ family protein C protein 8
MSEETEVRSKGDDDVDIDATFAMFMNEVDSIQSSKMQQMLGDFGSAESQVERLTSRIFTSAYDVMMLGPDADEKTIKAQYRKLSALVHPDKCRHSKAHEAFLVVKKAQDDLMDPNYHDKYKDILPVARKNVYERRKAANPERMKRGEDPLELEGLDFNAAVIEECEAILRHEAEEADYAERVRKSNEERLEESRKRRVAERNADRKKQKQWENTRELRVAGWRAFQDNVQQGHVKTATVGTIHTKKEESSKNPSHS